MDKEGPPVYNALHTIPEEAPEDEHPEGVEPDEYYYDEHDDDDHHDAHAHEHHHGAKKEAHESFNFTDVESMMWRKVRICVLT
jgi:hypothetical protein